MCQKEFTYEKALIQHMTKIHANSDGKILLIENRWFECSTSSDEEDLDECIFDQLRAVPIMRK